MGEIVPAVAPASTARRVLLVGQAPGSAGDKRPLTGAVGRRLSELAGLEARFPYVQDHVAEDEAVGFLFDRANVLDLFPGRSAGKGHLFPMWQARRAAAWMWASLAGYERVLFCGKAVYEAFRTCEHGDPAERRRRWCSVACLEWTGSEELPRTEFAWMHHPSAVVRWWNHPANVRAAALFLTELVEWTIAAPVAA